MKRILNKKLLILVLAAAVLQVMVLALTGCTSGSKPAPAAATVKVRFDDTEILKSPLLTRRGDGWALLGSMDLSVRNTALGCDVLLLSDNTGTYRTKSPMLRVKLIITAASHKDDVHPDTPTALRVIVGSTCYSFRNFEMGEDGYARLMCGNTARSMLAALADCDKVTFEVDYKQYGTGKEDTFTAVVSRSRLSEWRKMAVLLENSNLWDVTDPFYLSLRDDSASITRR